jgi:hypothetical protein
MKRHFIFILLSVLFGYINANAQNSKLKYLLVEVYTDSGFINLDTAKHSMGVYSLKKNKKKEIKALPQQIFCFGKSKSPENILLEIGKNDFNISIKKVQSKFAVLKVYMNADALNNNANIAIKGGDVIYILTNCINCHKIEVLQLPIIVGSDGSPTTGYKVLNDYILK